MDDDTSIPKLRARSRARCSIATVAGAPRQKRPDYLGPNAGGSVDCVAPDYDLFASNALFFFGIDADEKRVHVVPQS